MSDLSSKEIDFNAIEVPEIVTVLKALQDRRFATHYAPDAESARRIVKEIVPPGSKVGTGDSTSVNQLGIAEALEERGSTVYVAHARGRTWEETHRNHVLSYSSECKFFLTGSNAITLDGRLVNVDASGNRVAGMFYGHNESILVVGRNKIVKDLDEAFDRLRHQISPQHVKIRSTDLGGRPFKTGCVKTAQCVDCRGDDRTCNIFTVLEFQPKSQRIHVVLVNLDLGLGWDESWPDGRIGNIIEEYKKLVWVPPHNLGPSLAAVEGTSGK